MISGIARFVMSYGLIPVRYNAGVRMHIICRNRYCIPLRDRKWRVRKRHGSLGYDPERHHQDIYRIVQIHGAPDIKLANELQLQS